MRFPSWSNRSVCFSPRGRALQSQKVPVKLSDLKGSGRGEDKRAESEWGVGKGDEEWLTFDSYTHKQMGKTLKGKKWRKPVWPSRWERSRQRREVERLKTETLIQADQILSHGIIYERDGMKKKVWDRSFHYSRWLNDSWSKRVDHPAMKKSKQQRKLPLAFSRCKLNWKRQHNRFRS